MICLMTQQIELICKGQRDPLVALFLHCYSIFRILDLDILSSSWLQRAFCAMWGSAVSQVASDPALQWLHDVGEILQQRAIVQGIILYIINSPVVQLEQTSPDKFSLSLSWKLRTRACCKWSAQSLRLGIFM